MKFTRIKEKKYWSYMSLELFSLRFDFRYCCQGPEIYHTNSFFVLQLHTDLQMFQSFNDD